MSLSGKVRLPYLAYESLGKRRRKNAAGFWGAMGWGGAGMGI